MSSCLRAVFAVDDVPHVGLFDCGLDGGTMTGFTCRGPTIIIPFMSDQPFWGDPKRGVGPRLITEALAHAG